MSGTESLTPPYALHSDVQVYEFTDMSGLVLAHKSSGAMLVLSMQRQQLDLLLADPCFVADNPLYGQLQSFLVRG